MKKFSLPILLVLGFTMAHQRASAQWNLFSQLLNQTDTSLFNQFFNNLADVDTTWSVNHVQGNDMLNHLYDDLDLSNPGGALDFSYITGIDAAIDTLINHLPGYNLDSLDQDTLLGEIVHIQNIFDSNFDSLANLFNQYQDSLSFDSINWNVTIIDFNDISDDHFNLLQDSLNFFTGSDQPIGPHNFTGLISKLFSSAFFPDLELAFGRQSANLEYWGLRYGAEAKVIRIGSVPRFDKVFIHTRPGMELRLPIEARWHFEASWNPVTRHETFNDINNVLAPNYNIGKAPAFGDKGFNPLLLSGDFAIMATPKIGRWGNTYFRILTSLGMEAGTYAPAHREYRSPYTSYNKGYATGYGPQAGGGFSMATGSLVIYTMTTVAHGTLVHCPMPYKYNSWRIEAGMRFGDIINVRYSKGRMSWQDHNNRRAEIGHQVTVGIILKQLNH